MGEDLEVSYPSPTCTGPQYSIVTVTRKNKNKTKNKTKKKTKRNKTVVDARGQTATRPTNSNMADQS